jgi:hypothetical protein
MTPNTLEITIPPNWDDIERIRAETEGFLRSKGFGDEVITTLLMVSSELAENAVKYGNFSRSPGNITHCVDVASGHITVEVRHPTRVEDTFHLARLDREIQRIRGFQNPFEAYLQKVREVSAREMHDRESGLGLVRIAYEGQSILDFFLDDGGVLCVSAVYYE